MSTSDARPLTRRELRELRKTGQNPVVPSDDELPEDVEPEDVEQATMMDVPVSSVDDDTVAIETLRGDEGADEDEDADEVAPAPTGASFGLVTEPAPAEDTSEATVWPSEPVAEDAEDVANAPGVIEEVVGEPVVDEPTIDEANVEEAPPLTRRQLREQERARTGQIGVVSADEHADEEPNEVAPVEVAPVDESVQVVEQMTPAAEIDPVVNEHVIDEAVVDEPARDEAAGAVEQAGAVWAPSLEPVEVDEPPVSDAPSDELAGLLEDPVITEPDLGELLTGESSTEEPTLAEEPIVAEEPAAAEEPTLADEPAPAEEPSPEDIPTLDPAFGTRVTQPPALSDAVSFEDLITRPQESSGSGSAASALILPDMPATAPLNAPITATGELLITSSHQLPEGFGSRGAAAGTTDGKDIDAVLIDGELPLASSPTPIAASAAISTSKSPSEVMRPPAPERNQKLVLVLGITAAVLGLAVVGAVIVAVTSGVFQ